MQTPCDIDSVIHAVEFAAQQRHQLIGSTDNEKLSLRAILDW
jgi:hypothetical protein